MRQVRKDIPQSSSSPASSDRVYAMNAIVGIALCLTGQIYVVSDPNDGGPRSLRAVLAAASTTGGGIKIAVPTIVLQDRISASAVRGIEIVGAPTMIIAPLRIVLAAPAVHLEHVSVVGSIDVRSQEIVLVDVHVRMSRSIGLSLSDSGPQTMAVSIVGCSVLGAPGFGCFVNKSHGSCIVELRNTSIYACGYRGNSDGIQISQAGRGNLTVLADQCLFALNSEDGCEIEESSDGDLQVWMSNLVSGWNGEENIEIGEYDSGALDARVRDVSTFGQLPFSLNRNDGIEIRTTGLGAAHVILYRVDSSRHAVDGLHIETTDNTTCTLRQCDIQYNGDDGLHFDCRERAILTIESCKIVNNDRMPTANDILARCRQGILTIRGRPRDYGVIDTNNSPWQLEGLAAH